jgi:hypothetical protein
MLRTIETIATVMPDGTIVAPAPAGLTPGEHRVVIVVEERTTTQPDRSLADFPVIDVGPWPDHLSLRREDMYIDNGRYVRCGPILCSVTGLE